MRHAFAAAPYVALLAPHYGEPAHALPRRRPILMPLVVLSLLALSAGTTIAGIWAILGWLL